MNGCRVCRPLVSISLEHLCSDYSGGRAGPQELLKGLAQGPQTQCARQVKEALGDRGLHSVAFTKLLEPCCMTGYSVNRWVGGQVGEWVEKWGESQHRCYEYQLVPRWGRQSIVPHYGKAWACPC